MEKTKPFEQIAAKYQLSNESAKYFLSRIQKSFKKEKPPQTLILEFMNGQKFKTLPKPHQVATLMYEAGIWVHPMHAAPISIEDEADLYK
jgi:hypothetical protein